MHIADNTCYADNIQEFLICTTVHKARQLGIFTVDTFVHVHMDKFSKNTKCFSNSENPFYNEVLCCTCKEVNFYFFIFFSWQYFVFEVKCTLTELLRHTVYFEVKRRVTCKSPVIVGEILIDLQSVWHQPNRCFFKKWGKLESPKGVANDLKQESKGYLQIDLAIVSKTTNTNTILKPPEASLEDINKSQINHDYDDIDQ